MIEVLKLILAVLASLFKSRAELEAKNLILRQQINVRWRRRSNQQANAEGEPSLRIGIHVGDDLMGDGVNVLPALTRSRITVGLRAALLFRQACLTECFGKPRGMLRISIGAEDFREIR